MSVQVTEAKISEISTLSRIIRTANQDVALRFKLTKNNAPTHPSNCTDDWIKSDFEKGKIYYILKSDSEARGCVALEESNEKVFYLGRLGVLPKYRNKGHGTALVEHAKHQSRNKGGKRVEIGIIAENVELIEWYEKRGFIVKEITGFDHLPFTVCFMYHDLKPIV